MNRKKPVLVTITKTRHKSQPWTFVYDEPGNGPLSTVRGRYADKKGAVRGALRKLKAQDFRSVPHWNGYYGFFTPKGHSIKIYDGTKK